MTAARRAPVVAADVAVIGGGLAGLATSMQLARRGRSVVCLEPRSWPRPAIGESLEFSAAKLLGDLGIETVGSEAPYLYPKTSVHIVGPDDEFDVWPPAWFARPPIWCSRLAFHTDRTALDHRLFDVATRAGVMIVPERAARVEHESGRITALVTDGGTRVTAGWYVDASGHGSRVLGRALDLDRELLGSSRTAYWTRFAEPPTGHATTLYFPDPAADDLAWAWEIPLNAAEISVGAVMPAARAARSRADGLGPKEIFARHVASIPRLRRLLGEHHDVELHATTYSPYRHRRTVGSNWILVGDAAAMVDPLTSNGVTSALRHAAGAARVVSGAIDGDRRRRRDAWAFHHTAPANIATLDRAIETFLYEPRVRRRVGLRSAVTLYAGTGVVTNSLYAKLDPATSVRALACAVVMGASRAWTRVARAVLPHLVLRRGHAGAETSGVAAPTPSDAVAGAGPTELLVAGSEAVR